MKSKRLCKAQRSSSDKITTLPETILETILCLLPTKETARTSILSREWRYKWTKIPKLEFRMSDVCERVTNENQVQGNKDENWVCTAFYDLHQILLSHQGPIHEFTLHMDVLTKITYDVFVFDQILLHLSKYHTVKKLTLSRPFGSIRENLPVSVFSLHHLTDLIISHFCISHQPTFNGFGSLRSLVLHAVEISSTTLVYLLSNCPSLKVLNMTPSLHDKDCTIIELFKCLTMIEHLTTWHHIFPWLVQDAVPKGLATSLFHLKYFCLKVTCLYDRYGLAFLLALIRSSPNLEKLKIEISWHNESDDDYSVGWEKYSDVWLEHLTELQISDFGNAEPEMEFVKFILARSPKLKKVNIAIFRVVRWPEVSEIFQTILQAPRASPVTITFEYDPY